MAEQAARVGVVIATWEDTEQTLACLRSLLDLNGIGQCFVLRVVVSDDGSSAPVLDELRSGLSAREGSIELVGAAQRSGFAAAVNRGIECLAGFRPDYLWVLNNDTRLAPGALEELLLAAQQQPEVAIWGSTLVAGAQGDRLECAGGCRYSPLTTRNAGIHAGRRLAELDSLQPESMDYVHGAAMFFPAPVLAAAGGFCEDYFLYFEEQDLVKRLPAPAHLAWCRDSVVYHVGAASTGGGLPGRSRMQQYYENLSTLRFTRRFYPGLLPWVFLTRLLAKPVLFALRGEWQLYSPFAQALSDYLLGKPPRRFR